MGKTPIAITDSSDGPVPAPAVPAVELADTTIHLTLQGKGGVGKSLVAVILAQYLSKRGLQIQCIDTVIAYGVAGPSSSRGHQCSFG
jgi:Mrp family chromosome partitioning ATPase